MALRCASVASVSTSIVIGDVLQPLYAPIGGHDDLGEIIRACGLDTFRGRPRRQNADAVRSQILEAQTRALKQLRQRLLDRNPRRHPLRSLGADDARDVDHLQPGLARQTRERLRQRLRWNLDQQRRGRRGLGKGRGSSKCQGRAERYSAEQF